MKRIVFSIVSLFLFSFNCLANNELDGYNISLNSSPIRQNLVETLPIEIYKPNFTKKNEPPLEITKIKKEALQFGIKKENGLFIGLFGKF